MTKQYTVGPAYIGNDEVTKYIDGETISYEVMPYWETDDYCNSLEGDGYSRAYDLNELLEELVSAKERYELAQKMYNEAIPYRLIKSD